MTHTKDEALKLALYALEIEDAACRYMKDETPSQIVEAITAIKQALAAPVQEPVAIALNTGTKQGVKWLKNVEHGENLYTTPPAAKRQWVELTADEMEGLYQSATYMDETDHIHMLMLAEAKLKEKNND